MRAWLLTLTSYVDGIFNLRARRDGGYFSSVSEWSIPLFLFLRQSSCVLGSDKTYSKKPSMTNLTIEGWKNLTEMLWHPKNGQPWNFRLGPYTRHKTVYCYGKCKNQKKHGLVRRRVMVSRMKKNRVGEMHCVLRAREKMSESWTVVSHHCLMTAYWEVNLLALTSRGDISGDEWLISGGV